VSISLNLAIPSMNKVLVSPPRSLLDLILCNVQHVQTEYEVKGIYL